TKVFSARNLSSVRLGNAEMHNQRRKNILLKRGPLTQNSV
ncbi:hypothetical protein DBR06_SOUSAS710097, partial [Sousa chinensis]